MCVLVSTKYILNFSKRLQISYHGVTQTRKESEGPSKAEDARVVPWLHHLWVFLSRAKVMSNPRRA